MFFFISFLLFFTNLSPQIVTPFAPQTSTPIRQPTIFLQQPTSLEPSIPRQNTSGGIRTVELQGFNRPEAPNKTPSAPSPGAARQNGQDAKPPRVRTRERTLLLLRSESRLRLSIARVNSALHSACTAVHDRVRSPKAMKQITRYHAPLYHAPPTWPHSNKHPSPPTSYHAATSPSVSSVPPYR